MIAARLLVERLVGRLMAIGVILGAALLGSAVLSPSRGSELGFGLSARVAAVAAQALPAPPAPPAPAATSAPPRPVAALLLDDGDVRKSTLIGPSGQIYEPASPGSSGSAATAAPDAAPSSGASASEAPRWIRRVAGGVSSTVAGAARMDGELLVSGAQTPMFRYREDQPGSAPSGSSSPTASTGSPGGRPSGQWLLAQLGQRGRILYSSGPFFALAIGRQIFVAGKAPAAKTAIPSVETPPTLRLLRVGTAPGNVLALWASSETSMYLLTDQGVFRRRGSAFLPASKQPGVIGFSGAAPHALTADTAINLRTGARVRLPGLLLRVARSSSTPAALVRAPSGALVLARDVTNPARNVELPPPPAAQLAPPAAPAPAPSISPSISPTPAPAPSTGLSPAAPEPSINALVAVDAAGRALLASPSALLVYDGAAWTSGVLADELPAPRPGPAAARSR